MRFIGCKTLLLDKIENVINENIKEAKSFCDLFSGTSTVARFFKNRYKIISNDLLYFSYVLQKGTVEIDSMPKFDLLKNQGINDPINYINTIRSDELEVLPCDKRFFQNTYSPKGERMYFTEENALRIDFARNLIEKWKNEKLLTENEYFYLLACFIEGIPFISNISGTYGAFHKTWDKRAFKTFQLERLPIISNNQKNECFNKNGGELLNNISGDILYLDPPYNNRQYLPNYHVLETAALYDFPKVHGVTGLRDYNNEKSDFCSKAKVQEALENIVKKAKFKHIILSYSTEGLMTIKQIEDILKQHCNADSYKLYKYPYRRYQSKIKSIDKTELSELIFYIKKDK